MKRLFINILLFLLPLVIIIYVIPCDRRQRYIQLKQDCSSHGIWFFDRLTRNDTPVDVVFLGSSHTINGIMDEAIDAQLNLPSVHVVNFGHCRYGMNLYYVFLKEILRSKKPKMVFLEVREDENRYSHPVFPYVADASDVFSATPFFNRDLVRDYFNSFLYRLQLLKVQYFKGDSLVPFRNADFGFMGSADTASKAFLEKVRLEHARTKPKLNSLARDFYMTYPRIYLKKLSELCVEHNIRLYFLYIPGYGSPADEPMEMKAYRKFGEVMVPPHEIFEDPDNWFDDNHLNHAGAGKLSGWVTGQIRKKLPEIQSNP